MIRPVTIRHMMDTVTWQCDDCAASGEGEPSTIRAIEHVQQTGHAAGARIESVHHIKPSQPRGGEDVGGE
jgi:hypothetical protein